MLSAAGFGQNLLKNPGLEVLGNAGAPASWNREYNEKLSGPSTVVANARGGKRAMCLLTQEWNFLRPQYLTQEVMLPAGARSCTLSAYCKGQGLVNLVFQFRKGGKPLETTTQDLGFGPTTLPKEFSHVFALEQTYQRCQATTEVPAGADAVLVKVGNTVDLADRLGIWGKLYVDDISLTTTKKTVPPQPPAPALAPSVTTPAGQVDIAPFTRITTEPVSFNTGLTVDGNTATSLSYCSLLERGGNVNFSFPKPLPISRVQFYVTGWAGLSAFTIRGDANGDGQYEVLLAHGEGIGKGPGWLSVPVETKKSVMAIRLQAIQGQALYSFRSTSAFTSEVKILVLKNAANQVELGKWAAFHWLESAPDKNVPAISLQPLTVTIPPAAKPRFRKMVCADLWMWGVDASTKDAKIPDFANNPTFQQTVKGVKALGVTWIEIDLTNSSGWNLMPWPSKVCNGTQANLLKATVDALHREGFKVVVELIHNITPFETIKWHFPQEETSRYPGMKQYPSAAFGTYFRDNWLTILSEIISDCGADGVGLSSDESYYKPAFLATLPADDPGRRLYRERFGYDVPSREEDSLKFRQWVILRDEGICGVYGYISEYLHSRVKGDVYLNTMWMQPTTGSSNITENAIPWDMVSYKGGQAENEGPSLLRGTPAWKQAVANWGITEMGSDYMGPYGIRMASGVNGWRGATMIYSGNMESRKESDFHYYQTALWSWMYGAGSANYWRYNWIGDVPESYAALQRAYRLSDDLESLGAYDARPARKIAMLSSRAGLDWWQVNAWWGKHDESWDRGLQSQRGWFAEQTLFNILQQNGYAFDWKWLDRPDQIDELNGYRVLIVPFAYSVSKAAAAQVKTAVAGGATLILLDGHQGETDEWGEPYPAPVFKDLVDSGKAILVKDDILAWGSADTFTEKVTGLIKQALGADNPLTLNRYGKSVDATVLRKSGKEYFVFAVNAEKTPIAIDLGVAVQAGNYQVFARDENGWSRVSLNGKDMLTAKDLAKFRVNMPAEKPYVFYIKEAAVPSPLISAAPAVAAGNTDTWQGVDENWDNLDNWSTGAPPKPDELAVIPAGAAHYPVLTGNVSFPGSLRIESGARLCSEYGINIQTEKLTLAKGGELWLGVTRKGNTVIDAALKITGPLAPGVTPAITQSPMPEQKPGEVALVTHHVGPDIPADVTLANIAPYANITTVPYTTMARNFVDNDEALRTYATPEGGTPAKVTRYEFRFDKPQSIAAVQWAVVNGPWIIAADTTGNRQYDTVLRMDLQGTLKNPSNAFSTVTNTFWPPVKVFGIALINPAGSISLFDCRLLAPANTVAFTPPPGPAAGVPAITQGAAVNVPDAPRDQQILKGFHTEPWMFSLSQWLDMDKATRPPLSEFKPFIDFVADVKSMHGNLINLWPPKTFGKATGARFYEMPLIWPSQYDKYTISENALKEVVDAFHQAGITVLVMERHPYPKSLEEYPKTATSTQDAPYIDREFREYLAGTAREMTQAGADIVGIGWDEQKFSRWSRGPGYPSLIDDPKNAGALTRQYFQEHYHSALPDGPSDTVEWRKWMVYSYDAFASWLADGTAAVKAANPKALTKTPITPLDTLWNDRLDYGAAHDIIGHTADLDYIRAYGYETSNNITHYVTAAETKRTIAANKNRGSNSLHNCPWATDLQASSGYFHTFTPVWMSGPPISAVMNGGSLPMYWRENFTHYGGYDKYVGQAFSILDTLSAWGVKNARVPRSVAVLKSRASEDWWQVRQRYNPAGNPLDQTRGFLNEKWLLELLFTNGYPFDIYSLEHPEDFAQLLGQYDLVILPFAYSIKQSTYDLLAAAAARGTKIMLVGQLGETDEWGEPYAAPLFKNLADAGKVSYISDDVTVVGHYSAFLARVTTLIDEKLGDKKLLYLNNYGNDVEMTCLEKNPRERFVCLINWEDRPIEVDAGVNMPAGRYQVLQRDLESVHAMQIAGKDAVSESDLRKFRVPLAAGEIKVFYVHPAE